MREMFILIPGDQQRLFPTLLRYLIRVLIEGNQMAEMEYINEKRT